MRNEKTLKRFILTLSFLLASCHSGTRPRPNSAVENPRPETQRDNEEAVDTSERSSVGNGTDKRVPDTAFWMGEEAISVCAISGKGFSLARDETRRLIETSFGLVQEYIQKKRVNEHLAGSAFLKMNFRWREVCEGDEDLVFLLGEPSTLDISNIEKIRLRDERSKYQDPRAFYGLRQKTTPSGRNRAFMWVENPASRYFHIQSKAFQALITHEILHLAGCGHVPNTIMDEKLLLFVLESYERGYPYGTVDDFLAIDWKYGRELFLCEECSVSSDLVLTITEPEFEILNSGVVGKVKSKVHHYSIQVNADNIELMSSLDVDFGSHLKASIFIRPEFAGQTRRFGDAIFRIPCEKQGKSEICEFYSESTAFDGEWLGFGISSSGPENVSIIRNANFQLEIRSNSENPGGSLFSSIPSSLPFPLWK